VEKREDIRNPNHGFSKGGGGVMVWGGGGGWVKMISKECRSARQKKKEQEKFQEQAIRFKSRI